MPLLNNPSDFSTAHRPQLITIGGSALAVSQISSSSTCLVDQLLQCFCQSIHQSLPHDKSINGNFRHSRFSDFRFQRYLDTSRHDESLIFNHVFRRPPPPLTSSAPQPAASIRSSDLGRNISACLDLLSHEVEATPLLVRNGWLPSFDWLVCLCEDCHWLMHHRSFLFRTREGSVIIRNRYQQQKKRLIIIEVPYTDFQTENDWMICKGHVVA